MINLRGSVGRMQPSSYSNLVEMEGGRVGVVWVEAVANVINPIAGGAEVHCRPSTAETPLPCQRITFALLERSSGAM